MEPSTSADWEHDTNKRRTRREVLRTLTEIDFSTPSTPIPFQVGGTGTLNGNIILTRALRDA